MNPTTIVFADERPVLHKAFTELTATFPTINTVSTVSEPLVLFEKVQQCQPHLVITDIRLGMFAGPVIYSKIRELSPHTSVIAYTDVTTRLQVEDMLCAGVHSYVLKTEPVEKLLSVIEAVRVGGEYCSPAIIPTLRNMREGKGLRQLLKDDHFSVLQLNYQGYSNAEIADQICKSIPMVEKYRKHVLEIFNLTPRQLKKWCVDNGIVGVW